MSPFWVAFASGIFIGVFIGIIVAALLTANRISRLTTYDSVLAWLMALDENKRWVVLSELVKVASQGAKSIGYKPYRVHPRREAA